MYYASGSGFLKGNFIIIKIQYNLTPCVSHSSIRGSICAADRQDNLASVPPTESHGLYPWDWGWAPESEMGMDLQGLETEAAKNA